MNPGIIEKPHRVLRSLRTPVSCGHDKNPFATIDMGREPQTVRDAERVVIESTATRGEDPSGQQRLADAVAPRT